jgi:GNAT superfamily N-acetyltransferase
VASVPDLVRLCPHVATETFSLDDAYEELQLDLERYSAAFNDGDETLVYVLVEEARVVAYVAISELTLNHRDLGQLRCLSLPALAVDAEHRGSNFGPRLILQAWRVMDLRQHAHLELQGTPRYDGIACIPWGTVEKQVRALERFLRNRGFRPVPDDFWWFQPWQPGGTGV